MSTVIRQRDRDTIIQALSAGVVPRTGLHYIQVGRVNEIEALVRDIGRISDGGSAARFVIGEYGAGKTFFLNLIRLIALERRCVTIHADLAPDRRLHATGGQARFLYAEAMRNMATRTKPDGGAIGSVVERFITESVKESGGSGRPVDAVIDEKLSGIMELTSGFDFAAVIKLYWRASEEADERRKMAALRWLRGEYPTMTEAREALGVRSIINDANVYDALKLMSAFVRLSGYAGFLVVFDEMVNLYKLQSAQARNQNFEQILRILNDVLQGSASGIGFLFGGTPEFLLDTRRGLYSYAALQSRLSENGFAINGLVDYSGPLLRLQNLTPEDLLVLLQNIRNVFAMGDESRHLVPDEALRAFMTRCSETIGEAYFRTPRSTIKSFTQFLSVLEQNPGADWRELLGQVEVLPDNEDVQEESGGEETGSGGEGDDDLTSFQL